MVKACNNSLVFTKMMNEDNIYELMGREGGNAESTRRKICTPFLVHI